jgi:hypothetical protein
MNINDWNSSFFRPGGGWGVAAQGAHPFLATKVLALVYFSFGSNAK